MVYALPLDFPRGLNLIMFSIYGKGPKQAGGFSRRELLRVGGLGASGLTMADLYRLRAHSPAHEDGSQKARGKSVIMIWLRGGASHIDSYDMKPSAPSEIRGEFHPISTKVPGIQICEYLPLQAKIMDKLSVVRGIKSVDIGDHTPHYIFTGFAERGKRPVFGSVVSHQQPRTDGLPPYVSLMYEPPKLYDNEGPTYLGPIHRPFFPKSKGLANLSLTKGISTERLASRKELLKSFDLLNRELDWNDQLQGVDSNNKRAFEMIGSPKVRDAFDRSKEMPQTQARYGKYCENFLLARRLVEAGVSVVTVKVGDWDTHEHNFRDMKEQLPQLDQGFHALISDLYDRGLEKDVAVVLWGEFGRAPRISRIAGRDHWPDAGAAVIAGGGFQAGQVIGETDSQGARSKGIPYTPANILSTLYQHLGIDPTLALLDHNKRPMPILDDAVSVRELRRS